MAIVQQFTHPSKQQNRCFCRCPFQNFRPFGPSNVYKTINFRARPIITCRYGTCVARFRSKPTSAVSNTAPQGLSTATDEKPKYDGKEFVFCIFEQDNAHMTWLMQARGSTMWRSVCTPCGPISISPALRCHTVLHSSIVRVAADTMR